MCRWHPGGAVVLMEVAKGEAASAPEGPHTSNGQKWREAMLSGINLILVTAFGVLSTVYLLRRRTRLLSGQFNANTKGSKPTT